MNTPYRRFANGCLILLVVLSFVLVATYEDGTTVTDMLILACCWLALGVIGFGIAARDL